MYRGDVSGQFAIITEQSCHPQPHQPDNAVNRAPISPGAKAWCLHIGQRSDDYAKPVYGMQTKQAKAIGRSARSVQRYRAECEQAKLIRTSRGPIVREHDGTVHRARTNLYFFCVPPGKANRKTTSSHRRDMTDTSNSSLTTANKTPRHKEPEVGARQRQQGVWREQIHEPCNGARWIENDDGTVTPCSCLETS